MRFSSSLGYPPLTEWPHAGRDRSPRDHADTRTLFHRVAGAPLEQIHSGRIRLLLPSNAVVFTGTTGRMSATRTLATNGDSRTFGPTISHKPTLRIATPRVRQALSCVV